MTSTGRSAGDKRARRPRSVDYARSMIKDWDRLDRSGRYNMVQLKKAMMLLIANEQPLGPEWLDHPLKGNWAGHRECHIGGDFLLVYRIDSDETVVFVRCGTHSELFDR